MTQHPRGPITLRGATGAAVLLLAVAGCGSPSGSTGVATNPPQQGAGTGTAGGAPSATAASGVRTVLSPLGLNIHSDPAVTAARLGTAAQGAVLSIVDHTDQNGGWFRVQGQTVTGWITADATLTAPGQFTPYQSSARMFGALYPQDWTFAEAPADVIFHPTAGPQSIVVRSGATPAGFGALGGPGFTGAGQQTVVVCGVTADLDQFVHGGAPPATPTPGTAGPLTHLAQVRLRLDATHALALDFNYSTTADLDVFSEFYNSMTFPFPQCQQVPTPAPTPT